MKGDVGMVDQQTLYKQGTFWSQNWFLQSSFFGDQRGNRGIQSVARAKLDSRPCLV